MTDEIEWMPVKVKLGDLSHWANNPVTLTKAQAGKLLRSKEKLGKMQTLAIGPSNGDGKYPLYDGHQRANVWGAAFGMGLEVWALQSSRPLTDEERHAVPIMLRTAVGSLDWDALAGWTDYPISEWGLDDDALQGLKFDIAALGNLLESETPEPADAEPQIDRAAELLEKWQVKTGDLWRIGEHRLLCGDSTRREDVERVTGGQVDFIFTDPPYGHNNNDGDLIHNREKALGKPQTASSAARPITNDSPEEAARVYSAFLAIANDLLKPGCCCCCCCCGGGGPDPQFARWALEMDTTIGFKHAVVWDKGGLGMGWHYRRCYEFVLVAQKPGKAAHWFGGNDVPNVIRDVGKIIPSSDHHPTEKPTNLAAWFLKLHSTSGDVVFEPFAGYGSTMVACQNLGRKCRAIEISPAYCAVTLERMATAFPGIEIERIE